MIEIQLTLASKETDAELTDLWILGYCFGLFDAMGRRAKLEHKSAEGLFLITLGFSLLMGGHSAGAGKVRQALDNQTDHRFTEGNRTGGSDLFAWFADANKPPMGLCTYVRTQRLST